MNKKWNNKRQLKRETSHGPIWTLNKLFWISFWDIDCDVVDGELISTHLPSILGILDAFFFSSISSIWCWVVNHASDFRQHCWSNEILEALTNGTNCHSIGSHGQDVGRSRDAVSGSKWLVNMVSFDEKETNLKRSNLADPLTIIFRFYLIIGNERSVRHSNWKHRNLWIGTFHQHRQTPPNDRLKTKQLRMDLIAYLVWHSRVWARRTIHIRCLACV